MGTSSRGLVDANCFYYEARTTQEGETSDADPSGPPPAVSEFVETERR